MPTADGYEAYLFDLDGTLVDTAPDIMRALNVALEASGYGPVDEALTRHWVGHGARKLIERAMIHYQRPQPEGEAFESLLRRFLDHYHAHIADASTVYPGVLATLTELSRRGAKLAVVTNKQTDLATELLLQIGLAPFFAAVVCGDTAARPKPAGDPALHACALLGVDVAAALFVGDSETDVRCARAAGCDVVCVRDGYNHGTPAEALGADRIIDSLSELV